MELPFISCKCITYGRVNLLEETIESFLRQDYPKDRCELIIINDYALQKLKYDDPRVTIINFDQTFKTIGDKENYATSVCQGDIICQWDDDDIALPNHLKNVAKYFTDETNILHWQNGIFYNEPNITDITWIGNSGIVFRKSAWEAIGKHPIENAGYDMTFIERLAKYGGRTFASPPKEEASWFYRWGSVHNPEQGQIGIYHQSGQGHDTEDKPNIIQRHSLYIENLRKQGFIPTGDIILKPNWKKDYVKMLKDFINKK